jgi:predicted DNA-binding transcriptional regulator AlpA
MTEELPKKAYSLASLSEAVELSKDTIYRAISANELAPKYPAKRTPRFPVDEVDRWIKSWPDTSE